MGSGIRDLPVPRYVFYYGAAGVLVVSFAASPSSGASRCLPNDERAARFPVGLQRCFSRRRCACSSGGPVFLLVFLWLGALIGRRTSGVNFTPTFVYVYFWVGMPLAASCSATSGRC